MLPGPAGTCSGRDAGNHQPGRCVTRATMPLAYAHDGPQPRRQKIGRCVAKALRLGALAALLAEVGAAGADSSRGPGLSRHETHLKAAATRADSSRGPGLSRRLVKSRKTWVGVVDDEIAVALRKASFEVDAGDGMENSFSTGDPPSQNIVLS